MSLGEAPGAEHQSELKDGEARNSNSHKPEGLYELRTQGHEAVEKLGAVFISTAHSDCFLQFCRHYGHPIREPNFDRLCELICILIAYAFVLIYPLGLLLVLVTDTRTQCLWLGYQLYTVLAMHIARLAGWMGTGRTEEQIAKALQADGIEYLSVEEGGTSILASLQVESFDNAKGVRHRVQQLIEGAAM
jgi:hypothetical protein